MAAGPPPSAIPAPSASTRSAFHGWSAKSGRTAIGTPPARPIVTVPEPPWQTIAATWGMRSACATQRSTRTLARQRPELGGIAVAPDGHQQAQRQRPERADGVAVEAREELHVGATEPKVT